jgi:hypothetical protein
MQSFLFSFSAALAGVTTSLKNLSENGNLKMFQNFEILPK